MINKVAWNKNLVFSTIQYNGNNLEQIKEFIDGEYGRILDIEIDKNSKSIYLTLSDMDNLSIEKGDYIIYIPKLYPLFLNDNFIICQGESELNKYFKPYQK